MTEISKPQMMSLDDFFRESKTNMYLSWMLTFSIAAVFIESLIDLDILWTIFSGLSLTLILLPPISNRDLKVMLPWEVLMIAAIPVIVRTIEISILANQIATYTSFAALALIIAVELHTFTNAKFNHSFAVAFTVISTLALAGIWSVTRYILDTSLGTTFLTTNEALMNEFIEVLVAGILAGGLFDSYFRRRDKYVRKIIKKVTNR